ncbi:hypothetical protein OsJ_14808 [Oryza sativa Japonica Group]|uniref:Uncharacterized protein n=1 Tax=Oryza sativa subsp. japonica TaxID=39947 RepID=A3ATV6_ORYSJ|nr:hypothetical protein OsJ_14808 [Oryza sativa Japonica Group]
MRKDMRGGSALPLLLLLLLCCSLAAVQPARALFHLRGAGAYVEQPCHLARRCASLQAIGPIVILRSAPPIVIIACSKPRRPPQPLRNLDACLHDSMRHRGEGRGRVATRPRCAQLWAPTRQGVKGFGAVEEKEEGRFGKLRTGFGCSVSPLLGARESVARLTTL